MFELLEKINERPAPFEFYTARELWTDEHTSRQMLAYHLNEDLDLSSRNHAFVESSVEWIAGRFNISGGTRIADFGCGPGLYASRLAKRGAAVTGIDFSARSIEYARHAAMEAGLDIEYVTADYLEFETDERFDLIIMIFCDFCALSPDQRKRLLNKFYGLLMPGGSVLLDVSTLVAFDGREECTVYEENQLNGFWAADKYYGFMNTFKYEQEKVALDKYTIVEKSRTRTVYNWLQYFSSESLEKEFVTCGFRIDEWYSDVAGKVFESGTPEMAVVASKK